MAMLIDMDMPDTCGNCIFGIDRKRCPILWRDFSGNPNMRYKDCPLREVVRCKDCKRYESDGGALMTCTLNDMITDDDCFCWWGERREE